MQQSDSSSSWEDLSVSGNASKSSSILHSLSCKSHKDKLICFNKILSIMYLHLIFMLQVDLGYGA